MVKYLDITKDNFYSGVIRKRQQFSKFTEKYFKNDIDNILSSINNYINFIYRDSVISWVGGSRSWSENINKYMNESDVDNVSIIPGNYDIFILSNNKNTHKTVVCEFMTQLKKYHDKFVGDNDNELNKYYDLKIQYGNVELNEANVHLQCLVNYPDQKGTCVLFPCQSIMMSIKSKRGVEIPAEFLKLYNFKLIVYFESYYIENINIKIFKEKFIKKSNNINFLNKDGLLLFSEFIRYNRLEKGINVDSIRKKMLLFNIKSEGIDLYNEYYKVLNNYVDVFLNSNEFSIYRFIDLIKNLPKSVGKDIDNDLSFQFINIIRPYINSFLKYLNEEINSHFYDNAFLVVVGGDAMRRYKYDITNTADIDTKIYVNWDDYEIKTRLGKRKAEENLKPKDEIFKSFIINKLSKFITYLNNIKESIFLPTNYKYFSDELLQMNYNFLVSGDQFRLRYIEKNESLPVDLFSIDFRTKVNSRVKINNNYETIPIITDIPFLDLVIQTDKIKKRDNVLAPHPYSDILPIASIDFLLKDLKNIYTNKFLAKQRYWNEKKDKDEKRYKLLNLINEGLVNIEYNAKNDLNLLIDNDSWKTFLDTQGELYSKNFKKLVKLNRTKHIIKHKMHFYLFDNNTNSFEIHDEHDDEDELNNLDSLADITDPVIVEEDE